MPPLRKTLTYYLAEQPHIVNFRWSTAQSWGSTWSFLFTSISLYVSSSLILHIILPKRRSIPLGPLPALHSLFMALFSATIFAGIMISSASEIHETRWFWHRSKTPLQWLLCFPLGTRPSGRVFFWSYAFYVSRFLRLLETYITILKRRRIPSLNIFTHSILILMSFLWLEFSQSFQVLGIVFTTLISSIVYGYRFWKAIGLPDNSSFPFVVSCQFLLMVCNSVCHVAVLVMHFLKVGGGCNGIGAWGLNSVLNAAILMLFLNSYLKRKKENKGVDCISATASVAAVVAAAASGDAGATSAAAVVALEGDSMLHSKKHKHLS